MRRPSPHVSAGIALAALVFPLYVFAAPLRLQLVRCDSSITDTPELTAQTFQQRTTYGLTQAVTLSQGKAVLVTPGDLEGADILVGGKLGRSGTKFRLVYIVQTKHEPKLNTQLTYEFSSPRLSDRGVTVMAQEIVTEAVKLEESRKVQAVQSSAPEVARAPAPVPAPSSSQTTSSAPAPVVAAAPAPAPASSSLNSTSGIPALEPSSAPMESSEPEEHISVRRQPLIVVHTGLTGLWSFGTKNFGFGGVVEPKWNITDSIAAGLRIDGGVVFGGTINPETTTTVSLGASAATLAKGEYFLGTSGVRPFVGLGAGVYTLASQSVSAGEAGAGIAQSGGRYFGVAPQLGIDFGPVRLAATYNHILGADIVVEQNINAGIEAERIRRNYVQVELTGRLFKINAPQHRPIPRAGATGL